MGRLQVAAGYVVLAAWASTLIDGFITEDYHGFDVATPVMLVFAGFMFGDQFLKRRYERDS